MRLYVSGPMTGYTDFNYPAFHEEKELLEARGYEVISPADLPLRSDWDWIPYILADIQSVFAVDGIATLFGYESSRGARIECAIAACQKIPIDTVAGWLERAAETTV